MGLEGLVRGSEGRMPSLSGATSWLNSEPLEPEGLRGRVVVVGFWTYTCINWLRTLPYLRAWHERYWREGLVLVGVHTPEFSFERDVGNVSSAVEGMGITYPVALDSDRAIWNTFANRYWPALYFVDATGYIRHHRFGEGDYEQSEAVIRRLLIEAGAQLRREPPVAIVGEGLEAPADWDDLASGETYLGSARTGGFASPEGLAAASPHDYTIPSRLRLDGWALSGNWTVGSEAAVPHGTGGRIAIRFRARDLHLVMGPVTRGMRARFQVRLDGHPPRDAHGDDVADDGTGVVADQRLYQLIRQPLPIVERQFEIEFLDPGVQALVFTFG